MFQIAADQIGGAIVRRTFSSSRDGGKRFVAGQRLSGDEVRSFPAINRNSLIEKRYIDVFPQGGEMQTKGERFVISSGFGKFHVIEGKKLNDEALDREQAYALAGMVAPPKGERRKK